ncbi:MAG: hypothetical protein R6X08_10095 [Desulfosalsimonadaceae bacterium]
MLDVRIDLIKNRLYLTLGWTQRDKRNKALPAISKAVNKLIPGFGCIIRIIDARGIRSSDIKEFQKVQQYLLDCGMQQVVCVGEESGKKLLYSAGRQYESICAEASSLEKAETLLDEWALTHPRNFKSQMAN